MSPGSGAPGRPHRMVCAIFPADEPNSPSCMPEASVPVITTTTPSKTLVTPSPRCPCSCTAIGCTSMIVWLYSPYLSGGIMSMVIAVIRVSVRTASWHRVSRMESVFPAIVVSGPIFTRSIGIWCLTNRPAWRGVEAAGGAVLPCTVVVAGPRTTFSGVKGVNPSTVSSNVAPSTWPMVKHCAGMWRNPARSKSGKSVGSSKCAGPMTVPASHRQQVTAGALLRALAVSGAIDMSPLLSDAAPPCGATVSQALPVPDAQRVISSQWTCSPAMRRCPCVQNHIVQNPRHYARGHRHRVTVISGMEMHGMPLCVGRGVGPGGSSSLPPPVRPDKARTTSHDAVS